MQPNKFHSTFTSLVILLIFYCIACNSNQKASLSAAQITTVSDSVRQMMSQVTKDLLNGGPIAWEKYFEKSPHFLMASDGQVVFPTIDSATSFIKNTLVKQAVRVNLQWSHVQVDPLTTTLAGVAAAWHEEITDISGDTSSHDGFFTATAEKASEGWQFRNAHWSTAK